jgi:hypothetical protein
MAEERDLAMARATDEGGAEPSKAELQRRMEEARESISQTVAEIKDTVVNQYNAVKETLDWREQYRRRPVAWSVGALGVGLVVGYSVGGAFLGGGGEDEEDYDYAQGLSPEDTRVFEMPPSSLERAQSQSPRAYAAHAITGPSYGSSVSAEGAASPTYPSQARGASMEWSGPEASGQDAQGEEEEASQGPGLVERFKQTKAYDRLQDELSTIGDRFLEELSKTAQTVVLPALFAKLKDLVGVDLGGSRGQQTGGARSAYSTGSGASAAGSTGASKASQQTAGASMGGQEEGSQGGSSYGTSENRGYGASA